MIKTKERKGIVSAPTIGQAFWVNNGAILYNLKDLEAALKTMTDKTFAYHVNREKNDFTTWLREVLGEGELGERLSRFKTRRSFLAALSRALDKEYN